MLLPRFLESLESVLVAEVEVSSSKPGHLPLLKGTIRHDHVRSNHPEDQPEHAIVGCRTQMVKETIDSSCCNSVLIEQEWFVKAQTTFGDGFLDLVRAVCHSLATVAPISHFC